MLVISGELAVAPEQHDQLLALIDEVEAPSRLEAGCHAYQFWLHRSERGSVHVFEIWEHEDALMAHVATDHYRAFATGLKQLDVRTREIQRYQAEAL